MHRQQATPTETREPQLDPHSDVEQRRRALPVVPASVILVALLVLLGVRTIALTYMAPIPLTNIVVRPYGDPQDALARIALENFTTEGELDRRAADPRIPDIERLVYQHAPLMLTYAGTPPVTDDTFIGVYYQASQTTSESITVTSIAYFYFSSDENGGMVIGNRLALFGQPIDRELIYRLTIIDGQVASAYYQAPVHRLLQMDYAGEERPVFAVASPNHNFRRAAPSELVQPGDYAPVAPLPHSEHKADPAHDPDFVALAAREALLQHGVDLSNYLYIEFVNPFNDGLVTLSARLRERWYYLHTAIAGLTRPGYNQVGIEIGFAPQPQAIEEIRLIAYSTRSPEIDVISVYLYPRLSLAA